MAYTEKEQRALQAITIASANWNGSTEERSVISEEAMEAAVRRAKELGWDETAITIARLDGHPADERKEIFFADLEGGLGPSIGLDGLRRILDYLQGH